jgi:CRISPR/Cas system-associated protein Csx1
LLNLIFIIHILACIWAYIGIKTEGSWVVGGPDEDSSKVSTKVVYDKTKPQEIYIVAVYFIITTLTTVGYGD